MREIFKVSDKAQADPGKVFYTITAEDVGRTTVFTDIGPVSLEGALGRVMHIDVGKRVYRIPTDGGIEGQPVSWIWQSENDGQRDRRLGR